MKLKSTGILRYRGKHSGRLTKARSMRAGLRIPVTSSNRCHYGALLNIQSVTSSLLNREPLCHLGDGTNNFNSILRSLNQVSQVSDSRFYINFTSCLLNARSVCNKTLIIEDFVVEHAIDLLGMTETWLHLKGDEVTIGELCPSGYRFVHTPRPIGTGGGVGFLYKQGFCTKI